MATSQKGNFYPCSVRFDHDHTAAFEISLDAFLSAITADYYYVAENSGTADAPNPHYHCYLIVEHPAATWTLCKKNLIDGRVKAFKTRQGIPKGQGGAAVTKVYDEDGWHRYMCKGTEKGELPVIHGSKNYDETHVSENHAQYWTRNEQLVKERYNNRKRSRDGISIVKHMAQQCKDKKLRGADREGITRELLDYYRFLAKPCSVNQIISIVNGIQNVMAPAGEDMNELVNAVCQRKY